MNPCPYTVSPNTHVSQVFNLFRTMGLRHLPVVNAVGEVGLSVECLYIYEDSVCTSVGRMSVNLWGECVCISGGRVCLCICIIESKDSLCSLIN